MNTGKNLKHTLVGIELVRKLSEEGKSIFTIHDAREMAPECGIASTYVTESLHHLSNTGWVFRLKKGLYSISSSFPGAPPTHEFEIATALVHPSAISHWSALHFHGMTEQIPQRVYVTTTKAMNLSRSTNRGQRDASTEINGVIYEFIKIKPDRFFGIKDYWVGESKVPITDPERTLLDGLAAPKYFGDWAEIYSAFESHLSKLELNKMVDYAIKLGVFIAKRLGWILEKLEVEDSLLKKLEVVPIKGYRLLDSGGPSKGPYNKRWMLQENLPGKVKVAI